MICIKHRRLKKIFMGIFLVFFSCFCLAQNPTAKSAFWNHVRFGGGIGLSFSNGGFSGSLSQVRFTNSMKFLPRGQELISAFTISATRVFGPMDQVQSY